MKYDLSSIKKPKFNKQVHTLGLRLRIMIADYAKNLQTTKPNERYILAVLKSRGKYATGDRLNSQANPVPFHGS